MFYVGFLLLYSQVALTFLFLSFPCVILVLIFTTNSSLLIEEIFF